MKIKISDYIADFFADHEIKTVFTVVGGGAMHMNESFGHHEKIKCIYNHHEQASAMAAEAYFRVNNKMAGVCVTSGPGAINALNGVAGAYQDSIPMIVVSGQTKSTLMVQQSGLALRTLGNQEFDIISALGNMTKYAETIIDPCKIRYCLEKAFYLAKVGRPGPCWLEIPVDIQAMYVQTETLQGYEVTEEMVEVDPEDSIKKRVEVLIEKLQQSSRPVIYAGHGIQISGGREYLEKLFTFTGIPVVTCWDSTDLIDSENIYYAGRGGIMGDRAGNFAVQNSDLLIAIGNRLNIYQIGYQPETWAREAYIVDVDIDPLELKKQSFHVDLAVCCDAVIFMQKFLEILKDETEWDDMKYRNWVMQCKNWRENYPVVQKKHYKDKKPINVYAFIDILSRHLPEKSITVVANGSASVVGSAAYYIKKGQRFIMNCAISSMGYDLPAAVGACVAAEKKPVICIAGDGSIMMNLQELQTIVTNGLPVKIFIINNQGYQQIRITQSNLFDKNYVGIGPDSRDLGFPDFEKIAEAFGIPYRKCEELTMLTEMVDWMLDEKQYSMLEVCCTTEQIFEPKSATKRLADGSLYSPPLEDLAPFLPREELKKNMFIPMWKEGK